MWWDADIKSITWETFGKDIRDVPEDLLLELLTPYFAEHLRVYRVSRAKEVLEQAVKIAGVVSFWQRLVKK